MPNTLVVIDHQKFDVKKHKRFETLKKVNRRNEPTSIRNSVSLVTVAFLSNLSQIKWNNNYHFVPLSPHIILAINVTNITHQLPNQKIPIRPATPGRQSRPLQIIKINRNIVQNSFGSKSSNLYISRYPLNMQTCVYFHDLIKIQDSWQAARLRSLLMLFHVVGSSRRRRP